MKDKISFQKFEGDWSLIADFEKSMTGNIIYSPETNLNELKKYFSESFLYIVKFNDQPVGYCAYEIKKDEAEITALLVIPSFQKRGIGETIMKKILNDLKSAEKIKVSTSPENITPLRLYLKYGFVIKERNENGWHEQPRVVLYRINKQMNKADFNKLIRIKAELLCYGIRENKYSQELYKIQNPYDIKKGGGYVGFHFLLNDILPILASTTFKFDKRSKYEINKRDGKFVLLSDDKTAIPLTPIKMPHWYLEKTKTGKPMSTVFAHEGLHYLHQQYSGCGYQIQGRGCKFCGVGCQWMNTSAEEIAETALETFKENKDYQVCLGGGARMTPGYGAEFFLKVIKLIRVKNKTMPIWIEMVPAPDKYLKELIKAGASAFGFNLEIWDDKLRKEICPGKSEVPKIRYFETWNFVQKNLGKNKVNTAIIVGLEPYESTLEGIHKISKQGVRLTLLPFKPWDKSQYANRKPAHPDDLFKLAYELAKDMIKYKVDSSQNFGCANCTSCTIEDDIIKYLL